MKESINIGPSPAGEDCAQVGDADYRNKARKECRIFRDQLRRQFGPEPLNAVLVIKSHPHDFGSYMDIEVEFESENKEATEYAYKIEAGCPELWDEIARREMGL